MKYMKYMVDRIDEDLDFGCEERPEGAPVMAVVTLTDEEGQTITVKVPDQQLYDRQINCGDTVVMDENGELVKLEVSFEKRQRENTVLDMAQLMTGGLVGSEKLVEAMKAQAEAQDEYMLGVVATQTGISPASVQLENGQNVLLAWTAQDRVNPMEMEDAGVMLDNLIALPLGQLITILMDYAAYDIHGILINFGMPHEFVCDLAMAQVIVE